MDRTMKVFFFFCFVVFFFTGCGKNGNRNEQVNGPDSKNAAKSAAQLKAETQTKELEEISKLLRSADNLFTQVWVQVEQNPDANPNNVFRIVRTHIDTIQKVEKKQKLNPDAPTETDKNKKAKPLSADLGEVQVFIQIEQIDVAPPETETSANAMTQASTTSSAVARPADAKKTTPTPPNGPPAQQKSPVNQQPKTANRYALKFQAKNSDKAYEIANFEKMADGTWKVRFKTGILDNDFNGLGRLSVRLKDNEVICTVKASTQQRLEVLNCGNIGQDLNGFKTVRFVQFYVNTTKQIKLRAEIEIKEDTGEKEPEKFVITDYDKENKLVIDITKIIESTEPEKTEPTSPQDQPTAGTQGAAPNEAGNGAAVGENKEANGAQPADASSGNPADQDKEKKDKKEGEQSGQGRASEAQPGQGGGEAIDPAADATGAGGDIPPEAVT